MFVVIILNQNVLLRVKNYLQPRNNKNCLQHVSKNGSLLDDPIKLIEAKDTMMQQLEPTWNHHQKLEFFKI